MAELTADHRSALRALLAEAARRVAGAAPGPERERALRAAEDAGRAAAALGWGAPMTAAAALSEELAGMVGPEAEVTVAAAGRIARGLMRAELEWLDAVRPELDWFGVAVRTQASEILQATSWLSLARLDAEPTDPVSVIRTIAQRLHALTDDVLATLHGGAAAEPAPFVLRNPVEDALDTIAPLAVAKDIDLVGYLASSAPAAVVGDVGLLRRTLQAILAAAVGRTRRGTIALVVDGGPRRDGVVDLEFLVTGSPTGSLLVAIPDDQGGPTGLVLASRLASLLGGKIRAHLAGEDVSIRLVVGAPEAQLPDTVPRGEVPALVGRRALVVERSGAARELLSQLLAGWGMEATTAGSGSEALLVARGGRFDVALVGHRLYDVDSVGLVSELTRTWTSPVHVVLMGTPTSVAPARTFSARVVKPVRAGALHDVLVAAVEGRAAPFGVSKAATSRRVLVVEDSTLPRRILTAILDKLGEVPAIATNGYEAVSAVERHPYDLVLMDLDMPRLDGFGATREIRARLPAEQQPRIVAVTGLKGEEVRVGCLEAGMDSHLEKPVSAEDLAKELELAPRISR